MKLVEASIPCRVNKHEGCRSVSKCECYCHASRDYTPLGQKYALWQLAYEAWSYKYDWIETAVYVQRLIPDLTGGLVMEAVGAVIVASVKPYFSYQEFDESLPSELKG